MIILLKRKKRNQVGSITFFTNSCEIFDKLPIKVIGKVTMKKTKILIFLTLMSLGMLMGSVTQVSQAAVSDTGLTKMSQLLDPQVMHALDSNGDGKAEITGIDAGAGMMITLNNYISGNSTWDSDYTVTSSSGAGMTTSLDTAYNNQEPIVVTLWSPHWAFSKYDLTYLQDDIGLYGASDNVVTLARQNLNTTSTDAQHLYNILTRFHWTQADCNSVMLAIQNGATADQAAQQWIGAHESTVATWVGSDNGTGSYTYGYVAWSDTIANSNVLKLVLEQSGYTITFSQLDAGVLYSGLSDGSVDFTTSAWLPLTQASYWNQYNSSVDWIRTNLEGAKVGLVVPTYMTQASYWATSNSASSGASSTPESSTSSTTNTPGFEAPLLIACIVSIATVKVYKKRK